MGTPDISDVHFHEGEPLRFKAEFEVVPEIELKEYKGVSVPYHDPEVNDEDVAKRIEELRDQKAEYVNVDPRPIESGDYAVVSIESVGGVEGEPVKQDEMTLHIGDRRHVSGVHRQLDGAQPGRRQGFRSHLSGRLRAEETVGPARCGFMPT